MGEKESVSGHILYGQFGLIVPFLRESEARVLDAASSGWQPRPGFRG